MTAAENFDAVGVDRLNRVEVAPHLDRIEATVNAAAAAHRAGLSAGLASARRSQGVALGATLVMFVLGLLLTGAVVAVLQFKRRLDDARRAEIERLRDAATRDSLTGLANHRAFHECLDGLVEPGDRVLARDRRSRRPQADERHVRAPGRRRAARAARPRARRRVADGRAFRIGGDEFAIVVEGGTAIDAFGVAQDLRERVAGATTGRRRAPARARTSTA